MIRPVADALDRIPVPARLAPSIALGTTLLAAALLRSPYRVAAILALVGGGLVVLGAARWGATSVHVGAAFQVIALVAAGLEGVAAWRVLLAATIAIVGWESARYGLALAAELGDDVDTRRVVAVHAGHALAAGGVGAAVLYAGVLLPAVTSSVPAVALLFGGVVAVAAAFRYA